MLDIVKSAVFGVVEGVTEWLPVSSTGHMIILDQFLSLDQPTGRYPGYSGVVLANAVAV